MSERDKLIRALQPLIEGGKEVLREAKGEPAPRPRPRPPAAIVPARFEIDGPPAHILTDGALSDMFPHDIEEGADNGGIDDSRGSDSVFQGDFEHELELREAAQIGPQGQRLDEMDAATQLAELKRAERAELAMPVAINPLTAQQGILGDSALLQPGSPTSVKGPSQRVVFWAGDDQESTVCSVTMGLVRAYPATGIAGSTIRPLALVTWGTRDSSFSCEVDIATGASLTLCASNVYVDVYLDAGSDTPVEVYATLGFQGVYSHNQPTRTTYPTSGGLTTLGAGASATIQRPSFAETIISVLRADYTAPIQITMLSIANATIGQVIIGASTYLTYPLVLPNDCVALTITNQGGVATVVRVVFGVF